MIEFNGYLTGKAERHYHKRSFAITLKLSIFTALFLLPVLIYVAKLLKNWIVVIAYFALICSIPFMSSAFRSKKEKKSYIPKRIYIEDDYITSVADKCEDIKCIGDVKLVLDYDEFYEIRFPFGKVSEKFICQKNLISKGRIQQFEALFEGKIVRKTGDG